MRIKPFQIAKNKHTIKLAVALEFRLEASKLLSKFFGNIKPTIKQLKSEFLVAYIVHGQIRIHKQDSSLNYEI